MIQEWLMRKLKRESELEQMEWTVDFEATSANAGTVFYEGGSAPARFDIHWRYPRYMIWISAEDWELAEYAAQKAYDVLHRIQDEYITVYYRSNGAVVKTKTYHLKKMVAESDPNPLGMEEGKRLFSVNFTATMIEI